MNGRGGCFGKMGMGEGTCTVEYVLGVADVPVERGDVLRGYNQWGGKVRRGGEGDWVRGCGGNSGMEGFWGFWKVGGGVRGVRRGGWWYLGGDGRCEMVR